MKRKIIPALCLLLCAMLTAAAAYAACEREEDHKYGSWQTKRKATCTQQGHQFKYCSKCDHWEQRYTAKLPHTPGEFVITKEATCTQTGKKETVCTVCRSTVRYTIDKLEHNYGVMAVVAEPACTKEGKGEYACADCGGKKRATIDELGHDWGDTVVTTEATCRKSGAGEQTCRRCSRVRTVKLAKLEHVWGEWTVIREPEGKRRGLRGRACTLCGAADEENFYHEGTLYEGMEESQEVIRLQEMLRDLGYYKGSIRSGQFGSLTGNAVARFQKANALEETGVADAETRAAVESAWEEKTGETAE